MKTSCYYPRGFRQVFDVFESKLGDISSIDGPVGRIFLPSSLRYLDSFAVLGADCLFDFVNFIFESIIDFDQD